MWCTKSYTWICRCEWDRFLSSEGTALPSDEHEALPIQLSSPALSGRSTSTKAKPHLFSDTSTRCQVTRPLPPSETFKNCTTVNREIFANYSYNISLVKFSSHAKRIHRVLMRTKYFNFRQKRSLTKNFWWRKIPDLRYHSAKYQIPC